MTLFRLLVMFVLLHGLMVQHVHMLNDMLDLISKLIIF